MGLELLLSIFPSSGPVRGWLRWKNHALGQVQDKPLSRFMKLISDDVFAVLQSSHTIWLALWCETTICPREYLSHFIDEEIKAPRGWVSCLGWNNWNNLVKPNCKSSVVLIQFIAPRSGLSLSTLICFSVRIYYWFIQLSKYETHVVALFTTPYHMIHYNTIL